MKITMAILMYLILAPLAGGLLAGMDRIITAKMQSRVGPPLLQPFYDVRKLFQKEPLIVNHSQSFYAFCFLIIIVFTGCLFFAGEDLLLVIFAFTLGAIFLVLGAYAANSPYSHIGAERELIQMMAYEPMVILAAVGIYMVTKSFYISAVMAFDKPLIFYLPGVFLGFVYILTIKFRKSPFDLSMSHHGHQEIVKGVTTEFSGKMLALIEIAHWYEHIFLLGFVYLFFATNPVVGVLAVLLTYFFEVFLDNCFARVKWQLMVTSSWLAASVLGILNLVVLYIFNYI